MTDSTFSPPPGAPEAPGRATRVALVDDHGLTRAGFVALLASADDIDVVATASTVQEVLSIIPAVDLVVLDLRLNDGSSPADNVRTVMAHGANVLIMTGGDSPADVRAAAREGALGMVRKSESNEALVEAVRTAAAGQIVVSTDWAAAIDADETLSDAGLSPREREVLALYASGEKAQSVAYLTGLSKDTVANYISRIRIKYAKVGRDAGTKIDLHLRALEDGLISRDPS